MIETKPGEATTSGQAATDALALRQLARRAVGMSGADIERLVREARQSARRAGRSVCFADLDVLLSATRPDLPAAKRYRMAIHEAGHAMARILLDVGTLTVVTIDAAGGDGFAEALTPHDLLDTEERCDAFLQVILAGRAAELEIYGSALAGSGGSETSDLAKATRLAFATETAIGFGKKQRLLYRNPDSWHGALRHDPKLARRVNARLDRAEGAARKLMRWHLPQLRLFADELYAQGTLEGEGLAALVASISEASPSRRR